MNYLFVCSLLFFYTVQSMNDALLIRKLKGSIKDNDIARVTTLLNLKQEEINDHRSAAWTEHDIGTLYRASLRNIAIQQKSQTHDMVNGVTYSVFALMFGLAGGVTTWLEEDTTVKTLGKVMLVGSAYFSKQSCSYFYDCITKVNVKRACTISTKILNSTRNTPLQEIRAE